MKITGTFAVVESTLYSISFDEKEDEFRRAFNNWQDPEYLENFFEEHKKDLENGIYKHLSVEDAVEKTIGESGKFEQKIRIAAKQKNPDASLTLENDIFIPLHKNVYDNEHIQSKAYGIRHQSWLRIYAIRLAENVYFITGSAIKLTKDMNPPHLQVELTKLKLAAQYLKGEGIIDDGDLGYLEISDYGEE